MSEHTDNLFRAVLARAMKEANKPAGCVVSGMAVQASRARPILAGLLEALREASGIMGKIGKLTTLWLRCADFWYDI